MRAAVATALAALLLAAGGVARAETVILRPAAGTGMTSADVDRVVASFEARLAELEGVRLVAMDGSELADGNGAACVVDPACVARAGASLDAGLALGVLLERHGAKASLAFLLVDTASGTQLAAQKRVLAADRLGDDAGMLLSEFLLVAPAEPLATPEPAPIAAVAAVPPGADLGTRRARADAGRRTFALGAHGGTLLPRGDLQLGPLAGVDLTLAPSARSPLLIVGGLDWTLLAQQDSTLVGPPSYPRSRADLIQHSQVVTLYAGAQLALLRVGATRIYGGAALGLSINRSVFTAYGTEHAENDVRPGLMVDLAARWTRGRLIGSIALSWREAVHDLGSSGEFGEDVMSGLLVTAGVSFAL